MVPNNSLEVKFCVRFEVHKFFVPKGGRGGASALMLDESIVDGIELAVYHLHVYMGLNKVF